MTIELLIVILVALLIILVILFGVLNIIRQNHSDRLERNIGASAQNTIKNFGSVISENQQTIGKLQANKLNEFDIIIRDMYDTMEQRLENMNKSLGEIYSMASGIDDLRKVISNVKTRGIMGELQLEFILRDILAPHQYDTNVATIPHSSNRVEFAVKLPGVDGKTVYLPIDSKFPVEPYTALRDAQNNTDQEKITAAKKVLTSRLKSFAKDIHTKYVLPPYTTDFGIMFLPFEGLYLEAIDLGIAEAVQRDYKINIAGPSTLAALLNALQMGFKTLALEERSAKIWETLENVKEEFESFASVLTAAQSSLNRTNAELDKLIGVRTRAITRALSNIEKP